MNDRTDTDKKKAEDLKEMSFLEHLGDLRKLIIQSLVLFFVLSIICWFLSGRILDLLISDLPVDSLYFLSPIEAFMVRMKISFVLGLMMAFPFILFKIWAFVSPGLFAHEKKRVYPMVVSSSALFYVGVFFCYFILIPTVLGFLLSFGTEFVNPLISVSAYFAFVARLCFAFGVVFQIPIVVLLMSMLGIVTPGMLLRQWRYGVVVVFVGAAVLTPPDVISLLMMALPVLGLYIASILVAFVVVRKKKSDEREVMRP
ncbi:MAG: twin-arginine translocase subunit TatC [Candidatus Latescibacterota bacterium]|nr:MAG: twin-arginine translocase subunit TatC [Candidatus Latescibacterota bacterium]